MGELVRKRVRVEGIVQGVGFRPFVYSLATGLGLAGHVGNDVHGVFVEVEGPASGIRRFLRMLREQAPPLAVVARISVADVAAVAETGFRVVDSDSTGSRAALVSSDTATCADCLGEITDPEDRRSAYPFTNCTHCGPRFTIVRDVPYDRPNTTMAGFALCARCEAEYRDPANRRFHAQPVCCPDCGPRLRLTDSGGVALQGDPLIEAVAVLARGEVLGVKGLGGYHLAVDATNSDAAATLRKRKHREDKPFAVMVASVEQARSLCAIDDAEQAALTSRRRPIVLLNRLPDAPVAPSVAPGNHQLGLMLPYTPLHHLLLRRFPRPIVLTSGNVSDEPIAYLDDDALARLGDIADAFLVHDRPIHVRTDDSVVRVVGGRTMPVRRSRGYVPEPVTLPWPFPQPVLACGAELKNTFGVAKGEHVFVSHHIGDLENYETLRSFTAGIEHFRRLFDVEPRVVAHDLHPEYLSTKYAAEVDGAELVGVQHHHAHIASCLADNGESGPVLGVAFDGTGYGGDGSIWGGEFLVADLTGFRRQGHLEPVPLPGGTTAIKQPWRTAVAYLAECGNLSPDLDVLQRNANWAEVAALSRWGRHAPPASSAGRLFDAVAAILGVRDLINYEGQAAIELEQLADTTEAGEYPVSISGGPVLRVRGSDLVRSVVADLRAATPLPVIAARFHNGLAAAVVDVCGRMRDSTGIGTVALSGGVFQNLVLLQRVTMLLDRNGFRTLLHSQVPPNDGGISLGQAAVAGALCRARR
ncbi:carbamoyltransferase HypF [Saccharopolyspora elongata]|uniref:Carbamoyltransferase n=1 Tax=Saccharopolyspora elongata TaxID=2530387 RepID=A0A4R4YVM4_9PSEU|nr:carbamoyltransferase HypF [Saccharopolyspora elongata]TDD48574.1 carbamoyltransferase HypF [Saccharopolyspora elongata]